MNNEIRILLIETLKKKINPTELEKHIIDTVDELTKNPFDSFGADKQIAKNYDKYPELNSIIGAIPNTLYKPANLITDTDRYYILNMQIELLCAKELGGNA